MVLYIRYTKGLGDSAIYTRFRDQMGRFWDFTGSQWLTSLTSTCKAWLTESIYTDDDSVDSLYSAQANIPDGGPWVEETVLASTGKVIGYGDSTIPVESTELTMQVFLMAYIGNASNVFSKRCGSFVGTVDFYVCSYSDFAADMNNPANSTRVCTLNASGVMSNVGSIATSGEVLFLRFSSDFNCLADTIFTVANATNKGTTYIFVPLGLQYVASIIAYYPTTDSGLRIYENGQFISLGVTAYGKALAMIPQINWDNISQPVQLVTTSVVV